MTAAVEIKYQGELHLLQKEIMAKYYAEATAIAEGNGKKAAHLLIAMQGKYDVVTVAGSMALRVPKKYLPNK